MDYLLYLLTLLPLLGLVTAGDGGDGGASGDAGDGSGDGDSSGDGGGSGGGEGSGEEEPFDADRAKRTIANLRREEKKLKKAKDAAEAKVKAAEDKDKTDKEKAETEAKDARERADKAERRAFNAEVRATAASMGMINPAHAPRLVDADADAEDQEAAIKDGLKALQKSDPHLFGKGKPAANSGDPANPQRGYSKKLTLDQINNMTDEEFFKREDEINSFLANQ